MCPFDNTAVAGSGKVGPVIQVNNTSWVALVTPTDRPKSVRNRCVFKLFVLCPCVVTLAFWHFCWCRGFCHRTESDIFLFSFDIWDLIETFYSKSLSSFDSPWAVESSSALLNSNCRMPIRVESSIRKLLSKLDCFSCQIYVSKAVLSNVRFEL